MVDRATSSSGLKNTTASLVPEADMRSCLEEQSAVFSEAVELLERLESSAQRRELGSPESVAQLQKMLDRVVGAQQKVMKAHERFSGVGRSLSDELRTSLKNHEDLLKTLISRIDSLQHVFEEVRGDLIPQLDIEARRRSMHAAYRQSMKTL